MTDDLSDEPKHVAHCCVTQKNVVFGCILRFYLNVVQHSSLNQSKQALDGGGWAVLHPGDFLPEKESQAWVDPTASLDAMERKINCSLPGIDF